VKKLGVLFVSYLLVALVENVNLSYYSYYLLLALTAFCLGIFCTLSNDIILKIYAVFQFVAMISYVQMIIPRNFYLFEYWFDDGEYSFTAMILKYEIIMLLLGFMDAYNVHTRLGDGWAFRGYCGQRGL
jgi:hypothetical protein